MIQIDEDINFGKPCLQFYLSDAIFTCPGQADNLQFPSLLIHAIYGNNFLNTQCMKNLREVFFLP